MLVRESVSEGQVQGLSCGMQALAVAFLEVTAFDLHYRSYDKHGFFCYREER